MTDEKNRDKTKPRGGAQAGSTDQPEENLADVADAGGPAQGDMTQDPLAGAMGQDSVQDDSIEDAETEDSGLPARTDPANPGGRASRNTSAPSGDEIGTGPDDVETGHAPRRQDND